MQRCVGARVGPREEDYLSGIDVRSRRGELPSVSDGAVHESPVYKAAPRGRKAQGRWSLRSPITLAHVGEGRAALICTTVAVSPYG